MDPEPIYVALSPEVLELLNDNQVDLVVTGSRGLSPVKAWLLGSVSRKLVHYAPCSVLITKITGG